MCKAILSVWFFILVMNEYNSDVNVTSSTVATPSPSPEYLISNSSDVVTTQSDAISNMQQPLPKTNATNENPGNVTRPDDDVKTRKSHVKSIVKYKCSPGLKWANGKCRKES